jgi:hypothetical protein
MNRKLIALVGESPNDTLPVAALLAQEFSSEEYEFSPLLSIARQNQLRGGLLDMKVQEKKRTRQGVFDGRIQPPRFLTILRLEYQIKRPAIVVFIRDLDALEDDKTALALKKKWFRKARQVVDDKAVFMLNIWELEALIWADLDGVKLHEKYKLIEFKQFEDPMKISTPKEELMKHKYDPSDCHEIFKLLRSNVVAENCRYYDKFLKDLRKHLA